MNQFLRNLTAAAALALAPALASAAPITLTFDSGTASGTANITATPVGNTGGTGAFGFNMTDTTGPLGSFLAWCLDIEHQLTGGPYKVTTTPFSNSYPVGTAELARVQSVFDANFATLNTGNNDQAGGFQVALWNALYDTDWLSTAGVFAVAAGGVATKADAFLSLAQNYMGSKKYNLTFLESLSENPSQNLITVAPVPLPAAAFLMVGALGGLAALRRRKQA